MKGCRREEEILVTPEMIEAGIEAYCKIIEMDSFEERVIEIFRAMRLAEMDV
jgi:hypothetical protein